MKQAWRDVIAPDSIRFQLLSRTLLILAILLVLLGLLQHMLIREVIFRNRAASLESQVMSFPEHNWEGIAEDLKSGQDLTPDVFIPGAALAFIDTDGNYFAIPDRRNMSQPPRLEAETYTTALGRHPRFNYQVVGAGETEQLVVFRTIMAEPGQVLGLVQISTSTAPLRELMLRQLVIFYLLASAALIFGLLFFWPVLKKILVPLSNMVDTAAQIDAGNLDRRFPTQQGQMEIDHLAESFNGMLQRLETSFQAEKETQEQMRRFIADASHELRTPLTSIHGFLEVLERGAANQPEQLEKALKSMHSESHRLNKLVHDLLLLSKLDRTPHLELKVGWLDTVVWAMEPQLRILAGSRKISIAIESNLKCNFDVDQIKQVILNLFQNAVQHTDPDKGLITLSLISKDQGVQLSIGDNGPGIKEENLPMVFDRFYRSEPSRARQYGGAGLGLAISKSIIEAHGGQISVISKYGQGSTFQVWLPQ